jgi:hypothetical protein
MELGLCGNDRRRLAVSTVLAFVVGEVTLLQASFILVLWCIIRTATVSLLPKLTNRSVS